MLCLWHYGDRRCHPYLAGVALFFHALLFCLFIFLQSLCSVFHMGKQKADTRDSRWSSGTGNKILCQACTSPIKPVLFGSDLWAPMSARHSWQRGVSRLFDDDGVEGAGGADRRWRRKEERERLEVGGGGRGGGCSRASVRFVLQGD